MDLLKNELIRRYFGKSVVECDDPKTFDYEAWLAKRVLHAMQEPIRKGLLVLYVDGMQAVWGPRLVRDDDKTSDFHPELLVLPDAEQRWEKQYPKCGECGYSEQPSHADWCKSKFTQPAKPSV